MLIFNYFNYLHFVSIVTICRLHQMLDIVLIEQIEDIDHQQLQADRAKSRILFWNNGWFNDKCFDISRLQYIEMLDYDYCWIAHCFKDFSVFQRFPWILPIQLGAVGNYSPNLSIINRGCPFVVSSQRSQLFSSEEFNAAWNYNSLDQPEDKIKTCLLPDGRKMIV